MGENPAVFNNAGQHYNHLHFWNWMKPNGGGSKLPGRLEKKITEDLGGLGELEADFAAAGVGQFGSGWCWLWVQNGKLEISKTANGESPLVHGATPILAATSGSAATTSTTATAVRDYLKAFCDSLINWDYVDKLYERGRRASGFRSVVRSEAFASILPCWRGEGGTALENANRGGVDGPSTGCRQSKVREGAVPAAAPRCVASVLPDPCEDGSPAAKAASRVIKPLKKRVLR